MAEEAEASLHTLSDWWPAPAYAAPASEIHEWEVSAPFPSAPLHRYTAAPAGSVLEVEVPDDAADPEPNTEKYAPPTVVGAEVEVDVLVDVELDVVEVEVPAIEVEADVVVEEVVEVDVEPEVVVAEVDVDVDEVVEVEVDAIVLVEVVDTEVDVDVVELVVVDVEVVATGLNTAADSA